METIYIHVTVSYMPRLLKHRHNGTSFLPNTNVYFRWKWWEWREFSTQRIVSTLVHLVSISCWYLVLFIYCSNNENPTKVSVSPLTLVLDLLFFSAAEVWDIKDSTKVNDIESSHSFVWLESRTNSFPEDPLAVVVPDSYCVVYLN